MGYSKVDYFGKTLIDLTADTVTPSTLLAGVTAHNSAGDLITGAVTVFSVSGYVNSEHDLTLSGVDQSIDGTTWVLSDSAPLLVSGTTLQIGG